MKKPIHFLLASLLLLGCVSLIACGGGGEKQQQAASTESSETGSAQVEVRQTSSGDWGDMPIFSGAKSEGEAKVITGVGAFERSEVRHYITDAKPAQVISYYKSKMPKKGWTKLLDAHEEDGVWGCAWQKKGGRFVANVTVFEDNGCHIILGRHEGKK